MAPAMAGALLNNIPTVWAVFFAGLIGAITYNLNEFCPDEPPGDPGLTGDDLAALLNPVNIFAFNAARAKMQQLVGHYLWPTVCQCVDGTAVPQFAPIAQPTGAPVVNPPAVGPSYPTGLPCWQAAHSDDGIVGTNQTITSGYFPLPAGGTYARVSAQVDHAPYIAAEVVSAQLLFANSALAQVGALGAGESFGGTTPSDAGAIPSGTAFYRTRRTLSQQTGYAHMESQFEIFCGTTPGGDGPVPTVCPVDPFTTSLLQQILELVTLIQRQAAAFATIDGSLHSGLSGEGEIAVQGLIGARIGLVDTLEGTVGVIAGHPETLFQTGWIRWGDSAGWRPREWLDSEVTLSYPINAGSLTKIGYSLPPGAVIDIVELSREP